MELESKSPKMNFDYNLVSTMLYEPAFNESNNKINLDVMRKHFYQEILASACLFFS